MREITKSRFSTGTNAMGLGVDPLMQPLGEFERLLAQRAAQAEPAVEAVEMRLKRVAPVEGGGLALVDIKEPVTFVPSAKTVTTGRFAKRTKFGWHFLDAAFSGEAEFSNSRDDDWWRAALEASEDSGFGSAGDGVRGDRGALLGTERPGMPPALTRGLWFLNRIVGLALVHRRGGVHLTVADLPTV